MDVDGRVHRRLSDPNCVVGNSDNGDSDNCQPNILQPTGFHRAGKGDGRLYVSRVDL